MADPLRIVTYAAPFTRDGPGLLYRDIVKGDDPQIIAALGNLARLAGDIVVLTDVDYDADAVALTALRDALARDGPDYPHIFSRLPNNGMPTGLDMDGDGRLGRGRDAQGFGRFAGQGGMAVLSRWPLHLVADYSALIWHELPFAQLPANEDGSPFPSVEALAVQRLSTTGHWRIGVDHPSGTFDLLLWSATPPVFDGVEDANGLRNQDELRLWTYLLDEWEATGDLRPFILAGNANLDPFDGQGLRDAMTAFLADARLQDPVPQQVHLPLPRLAGQRGPPELATAAWPDVGALRVTYVLPSVDWQLSGAGISVSAVPDPAGPHYPVWVDVVWP